MKLLPIDAARASTPEVTVSELLTGICEAVLAMYPARVPTLPWAGYLAEENGVLVGTCAFKTIPQAGSVEIAYFTFPDHTGHGVATRMAASLVKIAFEGGVTRVTAQTLPETNASTRILDKLGFRHVGSVEHPEDGTVWEWHRE